MRARQSVSCGRLLALWWERCSIRTVVMVSSGGKHRGGKEAEDINSLWKKHLLMSYAVD
jgi:hypothetical protein